MKTTKIVSIVITAIILAACGSSKKAAVSTISSAPEATTPLIFSDPAIGIFAPGNGELTAIQAHYKDITLDKLKEGHTIYTKGACIGCHPAQNIYPIDEVHWKKIIDDMAPKAGISDAQKDAVYKFVLAVKATQPK